MQPVFSPSAFNQAAGTLTAIPPINRLDQFEQGPAQPLSRRLHPALPDGSLPFAFMGCNTTTTLPGPQDELVIIGLLVAIVPWIVIGIVREATDDDTNDAYFVRAIFDNASTIVAGEDVKIAGVRSA